MRRSFEEHGDEMPFAAAEKELNYVRNNTIRQITRDLEVFSFNTAVARLMEFVNALYKYDGIQEKSVPFLQECVKDLILLIAPFAPHFAEELWEAGGQKYSVFDQHYPVCNEKALIREETEYALQINSKIKGKLMIGKDMPREEIESLVLSSDLVKAYTEGKVVKKFIVVPGRLINIIV